MARGCVVGAVQLEMELAEKVSGSPNALRITGSDSQAALRRDIKGESVSMRDFSGIVEHSPEDMVVTVRAGTTIPELEAELRSRGQCLNLAYPVGMRPGTVGGAIAMALPHLDEATAGTWRDWVLGMKLLLVDGTIVKCGSRAVKNVAGYDIQKLIVGSRGALALVLETTLRTAPLGQESDFFPAARRHSGGSVAAIQRTRRSDFLNASNQSGDDLVWSCQGTSTLWLSSEPKSRFPGDWVISSGCGDKNVEITDPVQIRLMKRAKQIFDPTNKLNPGEWGFM